MAELADALASGASDRKVIQVQVLLSAPDRESKDSRSFYFRLNPNKKAVSLERRLMLFKKDELIRVLFSVLHRKAGSDKTERYPELSCSLLRLPWKDG